MPIYLHPLRGSHGAPSGCIGASTKPHHDDIDAIDGPAALISIDPHGMALSDSEAEEMAAELCQRWNNHASLMEVAEIITADVVEADDLDRAADLARKIKSGVPTQITTVYEPYPGAFDDLLGPESAQ